MRKKSVDLAPPCLSNEERSVWNHSKEEMSRQTQINSTRRRRILAAAPGELRLCHMLFRMEAQGVTPIPVPMRTAISFSKT